VTVVTLCNFREAVPSRLGRAVAKAVLPELGEEKTEGGDSRREAANRNPTPLLAVPSPSAYVGAYYSDELDTVYRVLERSGGLVLERRGAEPERLAFLADNVLESHELGHLTFTRNTRGEVAGFSIQVGDSRLGFAPIRLPATP